jgi:DNA-binding transcriptional LysR family regulator
MRVALAASPEYLQRAGVPAHPRELASRECIIDTNLPDPGQWSFTEQDRALHVKVRGRFHVNNALAVREMLLTGQGIGLCPWFVIEEDVRAGRLQVLFEEYEVAVRGIYALYPHHRHLAARVRTFVDFLVERFASVAELPG